MPNDGLQTRLAHFGEDVHHLGAVVPPLYQNSLFVFETMAELHRAMVGHPSGPPYHYSRMGNPTLDLAERKIADLEGAEACRLVGSGMAAMTLGILSTVRSGSHAVVVDGVYGPTRHLFESYLAKLGVTHTIVDGRDIAAIEAAIRPETSLVYLESPTSLTFRLQDVAAIADLCRARGVTSMIDSTYNTPLHLNPIALGIDIVAHSCTKYFSGHSDLMAGAILGSRGRMERFTREEGLLFGGVAAPFVAWLLTRGLRTLKVRLDAHEAAANTIAAWLEGQPSVARVNHVGLPSHPQADLFANQYRGSGGLFSFEAHTPDRDRIFAFCDRLRLFGRGISWGGFESLVVASQVHPIGYDAPTWFIRLFIGLEDPEDLIADLTQALPCLDETA